MKRYLLLIVALLMAAGAAMAIAKMVTPKLEKKAPVVAKQEEPKPAEIPTQRVVVFAHPMNAGDTINAANDLTITSVPMAGLPSDIYTSMDVSSDVSARNRVDGWEVVTAVSLGNPVETSNLKEKAKEEPQAPEVLGNEQDVAFLNQLENDPAIVLFNESQLSSLRQRADVVVDISVETPVPALGDNWYGRELLVSSATLRAVSLDVTGHGAKPVFYVKLKEHEAGRVRAAQTNTGAVVRLDLHDDPSAIPPISQVCNNGICYEQMPDSYQPIQSPDDISADQAVASAKSAAKSGAVSDPKLKNAKPLPPSH